MNIPNILTVIRIVLTFVFIFAFTKDGLESRVLALVIFTAASLSDYFDGYLARKYHLITPFGKLMDPIADKFLILSAFFIFTRLDLIAVWMLVVIMVREILVTGLRLFAVRKGMALAAEAAGKLKTVLQIVTVYLIIIFTIVIRLTDSQYIMHRYLVGIDILMYIVVFITLWSGMSFIWNNRREIFHVR